ALNISLVLLVMTLCGCSGSLMSSSGNSNQAFMMVDRQQSGHGAYLAYEHSVSVNVHHDKIQQTHQSILNSCKADQTNQCTMLNASIDTGNRQISEIKLRIQPAGVADIVKLATDAGKMSSQSTDVTDLGEQFVDTQQSIDRLSDYKKSLRALKQKSGQDIDALVKLAQEEAKVQTDLEYAMGEKAQLLKRVQTDILNITLNSQGSLPFWQPINESMSGFGGNLSKGISQSITAVAFLIPWILVLLCLMYLLRFIWRKTTKSKKVS
ncbi:MAG: DUF4349 domain-containing protein, partial [Psychrosphaera sp.]|nr:DUF4349 domain-containing protein [Psychrosphaera sp.]